MELTWDGSVGSTTHSIGVRNVLGDVKWSGDDAAESNFAWAMENAVELDADVVAAVVGTDM